MPLVPIIPTSGLKRCILPPSSLRAAGRATEKLGNHFVRADSLCQGMPVPAVRAENGIIGAQVRAHAGGNRLFPDIGVAGAVNQTHLVRTGQLLLSVAYNEQLPVEREELL